MDVEYICDEVLPSLKDGVKDSLEQVQFYLDSLERYISDEESRTVTQIKQSFGLTDDQNNGDFWAENYPVYWDQIFRTNLRFSAVVTLITLFEVNLNYLMSITSLVAGTDEGLKKSLRAPLADKGEYLSKHGVTAKDGDLWSALTGAVTVRNCIVHEGGNFVNRSEEERKRLLALEGKAPGFEIVGGTIRLGREYPQWVHQTVSELFEQLHIAATQAATTRCSKTS